MPQSSLEEIVDKYVEMNIAHPFLEGNGRSTRIWLDQILISSIGKCVDWSKIDKNAYLNAMKVSPSSPKDIFELIKNALTGDTNNKELIKIGRASCRERV